MIPTHYREKSTPAGDRSVRGNECDGERLLVSSFGAEFEIMISGYTQQAQEYLLCRV